MESVVHLRDTPEYQAAWELEMWKQAEMAKHQRQLTETKKRLQAEWKAVHDQKLKDFEVLMAQRDQQQTRLEEKAKHALEAANRQRDHLQQAERALAKTLQRKEAECLRLQSECESAVLAAQESELEAKETLKRMEAVHSGLTNKVDHLQRQCLELQSRLAQMAGIEIIHQELQDRTAQMDQQHKKELQALREKMEEAVRVVANYQQGERHLQALCEQKDQELQELQLQLRRLQQSVQRASKPRIKKAATPSPSMSCHPPVCPLVTAAEDPPVSPQPRLPPAAYPCPHDARPYSAATAGHAAPEACCAPRHGACQCHHVGPLVTVVAGAHAAPPVHESAGQAAGPHGPEAAWAQKVWTEVGRLEAEYATLRQTGVYGDDDHIMKELGREIETLKRLGARTCR